MLQVQSDHIHKVLRVKGMVYTSGQIPINPEDGTIPEGITAQAEQ